MKKYLLILIASFAFSQHVIFEYGYTSMHSLDKQDIGYGEQESYLGFGYRYKAYGRNMKTTLYLDNWIFLKEDVFGSFRRNLSFYTITQTVSIYDSFISIYPGIEINILSEGELTSSTSYGSINDTVKKASPINYGAVLDLIYFAKKFSFHSSIKYSFNDVLEDRNSTAFRLQFGIGYNF